jgi:predicted nucleotidyltransferase
LATQPQLSRVVAFGSRARGHSKAESDLDLAVYFTTPRSRELERWLAAQAEAPEEDLAAPRLHLIAFFADEPPSRLDSVLRREGIVLWAKN